MTELLESLIPWGYQILLDIEPLRTPFLNVVFQFLTDSLYTLGFSITVMLVYVCISKRIGQGVGLIYLYSDTVNHWLKHYWAIPRPHDPAINDLLDAAGISRRINPVREYSLSPAFPSGHATAAVVIYGEMAYWFKKVWFWFVAVIMMVLISLSRPYLGTHYPQDIIAGALLGVLLLVVWVVAEPRVRPWLSDKSLGWRYALAVVIPLVVLLFKPSGTTRMMGQALGMGIGFVLESHTLRFSTDGVWWRRVLRGAVGVMIVFFALSAVDATIDPLVENAGPFLAIVWDMIGFTLRGFSVAWVTPALLIQARLLNAQRE